MIPKVKDVNYYMKDLKAHNKKLLDKIVDTSYPTSPKFHDRSGTRYGRLVVTKYLGKVGYGAAIYECKCDCGNIINVQYSSLSSGVTTSCGCAHADIMREKLTKHGYRHTRIYNTWLNMIQRCYNPKNTQYFRYGGRGIKVCDEWRDSDKGSENFINWAIENGYTDKLTIDRIDSDGNYCPENCRWVNYKVQGNNTSRNTYLHLGRFVFSEQIWAEILGYNSETLYRRRNNGWSDEEVLCTPRLSKEPNPCMIIQVPEEYEIYNKYNQFCEKGLIERDPNYNT